MHSWGLTVQEVVHLCGGDVRRIDANLRRRRLKTVVIHSQQVRTGSLFLALPGERVHGAAFIGQALENGATFVITDSRYRGPADSRILIVPDPVVAFCRLAEHWRTQFSGDVIAVTGSLGKTVTKDALFHLLTQNRRTFASPLSFNSIIGICVSLLRCPLDAEAWVIEASIDSPIKAPLIAAMLRPTGLIATTWTTRATSAFAQGRAEEWGAYLHVASTARWVVAADSWESNGVNLWKRFVPRPSVANTISLDTYRDEHMLVGGASRRLKIQTGSSEIAADVLLAARAALLMGCSVAQVFVALEDYRPTASRLEIWRSPTGITFVRDIETTEPVALRAGLRAATSLAGDAASRSLVVLARRSKALTDFQVQDVAGALNSERPDVVAVQRYSDEQHLRPLLDSRIEICYLSDDESVRSFLRMQAQMGDVVLFQTAPSNASEGLSLDLETALAPTRMYVSLDALAANVSALQHAVGPDVAIMAMVKAMAYGTDVVPVSMALQRMGVDKFAVAGVDEGIRLRKAGVAGEILVLLPTAQEIVKATRFMLTPLIYSPAILDACLDFASARKTPLGVHLEIDTGMHRTGLLPDEAGEALNKISSSPGLRLLGIMSHLACADEPEQDEGLTRAQLDGFVAFQRHVQKQGISGVIYHLASTAGAIRLSETRFDMVRLGLGLYGIHPSSASAALAELQPVVSLVSRIVELTEIPAGESVGYGATFKTTRRTRLAVVPAGYHDCIPRNLSNEGEVSVLGKRCPIVGRVSMDSMMIDVTDVEDAWLGTNVLIYGDYEGASLPIEDVAKRSHTIPYELMAHVGPRVQRIFTSHDVKNRPSSRATPTVDEENAERTDV